MRKLAHFSQSWPLPRAAPRTTATTYALGHARPARRSGRAIGASESAIKHARQRAGKGYGTSEALRELSHFRAAILDLCVEAGIPAVDADAMLGAVEALITAFQARG